MVEKAVRDVLITSTGVSAVVSSRVYGDFAPQKAATPFIVFRRVSSDRFRALDGPDGLVETRIEVDCFSTTQAQLMTLADEVRLALDNYTGTTKGVTVQRAMLDNEFGDMELEVSGGDKRIRRHVLDFRIWYQETAA